MLWSCQSGQNTTEKIIPAIALEKTSVKTKATGAMVTFEPGARTAWHTHPSGQTLIVTAGLGWVQREGGPIEEIRLGDLVGLNQMKNTGTVLPPARL